MSDLVMARQVKRGELLTEYYYMNEDTRALSYSIIVNEETIKVTEMNQNLKVMLNYFP